MPIGTPSPKTDDFSSLAELLVQRKRDAPDKIAYRFLRDGESNEQALTYEELFHRATRLAGVLHHACTRGERVLILCPSGLDYLFSFFACVLAEAVAVPAYPPRSDHTLRRLQDVATDSGARFALTPNPDAVAALHPGLIPIATTRSDADAYVGAPDPSQVALLQYTSGSAGTTKGVMLTHANVLANQRMIQLRMQHSEASVFVTWLPLFHDMGLIGTILQPIYRGIPCVFMSPVNFLQRPARWLRAITRYRGSTSGAPNFAYELCASAITPAEKAGLDLRSWDVAFNGAEPVRHSTIERFTSAFSECGFDPRAFYPCYGLAEASLIVTGTIKGSGARIDDDGRVSCGSPIDRAEVVVVHPEGRIPLPDGTEGEVWVRSPSVGLGYWDRPTETAEVFGGTLADGRTGYLLTGDLGILRAGELYITGRASDLIVLRGVNYYPQDIEASVAQVCASSRTDAAAAFTVDARAGPELVVLAEIPKRTPADRHEPLLAAIRRAIVEDHGLECASVVLVQSRTLPKTTSGKIKRRSCREEFLSGTLTEVARSSHVPFNQQTADIRAWLRERVAAHLGIALSAIGDDTPLIWLGLDSVGAVSILHALENRFHKSIPLELFFNGASLDGIALALEDVETPRITASNPSAPTKIQQAIRFFELAFPHNRAYVLERRLDLPETVDSTRADFAHRTLVQRYPELSVQSAFEIDYSGTTVTLRAHHSVADLVSMRLVAQEFLALYKGHTLPDTPEPLDLGAVEQEWLKSAEAQRQLEYWTEQLKSPPSPIELPYKRQRPRKLEYKAERLAFPLTPELATSLQDLAREHGTTPFVVLLTAWKLLISKLTGRSDVVIGTPVSTRHAADTRRIGCFVNTLALRSKIGLDEPLATLLRRVHETLSAGSAHRQFPLSELVVRLSPLRDDAISPLVNVMFSYETAGGVENWAPLLLGLNGPAVEINGVRVTPRESDPSHTYCDLLLSIAPHAETFLVSLTFASELYDAASMRRLSASYEATLQQLTSKPPQITPQETSCAVMPAWRTVVEAFESIAHQSATSIAAVDPDTTLTYQMLNERANQLARHLRANSVVPEESVGVCLQRTNDLLIAILGILKAGGVYCPLDPQHPQARLASLARRAGMRFMITDNAALAASLDVRRVDVEHPVYPGDNPKPVITGANLAYLMTTSGSTGEPKLVEIPHSALAQLLKGIAQATQFRPGDRFLATTTVTFDLSIAELLVPLTVGATVVLAGAQLLLDPERLNRTLQSHAITTLQATPSVWNALVSNGWEGFPGLSIWSCGEAMPQSLAAKLMVRGAAVWNLYGPTESTVYASFHRVDWVDLRDDRSMRIGHPIPGVQMTIDSGEIVIHGALIARGYRYDARATAEKFIASENGRAYRTGDRGSQGANGEFYCHGRDDAQLKIRGMRIEPGEIEAQLRRHFQVCTVAVTSASGLGGVDELVAVVQLHPGVSANPDLRRFLEPLLPSALIPTRFHFVNEIALTARGKVDRRMLALPAGRPTQASSKAESMLRDLWSDLLRHPKPPVDANFFDLGGHSLLLATLKSRLREEFGFDVSIQDLFRHPSIRSLSAFLVQTNTPHPPEPARDGRNLLAERRKAAQGTSA